MSPRLSTLPIALVGLSLAGMPAGGQQAVDPAADPAAGAEAGAVPVPAGRYVPLYASGADTAGIDVSAFRMDVRPVTVGEFLAFVRANPPWRRGEAAGALVDPGYLSRWRSSLEPGASTPGNRPVTEVSWLAARAYCRWTGGRLPTTDEWEYVAQASETRRNAFRDPAFDARTLALIQHRAPADALPPAGSTDRNVFGVRDLHGLVWEWTADFNAGMLTGAGRDDRGLDRQRFCAAGSLGTTDLADYAGFLRWAFRAGLQGATTSPVVGFRCAR